MSSQQQLAVAAEFARAVPPCPHFGLCGGCQLQDLAYSAQLEFKAAHLRTLLAAADVPLPELQLHASPPLAYRNRIRLTLAMADGQLRAGYLGDPEEHASDSLGGPFIPPRGMSGEERLHRSPTFVPITQCPIAAPLLWRAAEAFLALANADAALWPSLNPDQLELFTDASESRLQLTLYLRAAARSLPTNLPANFTALCESLRAQLPSLAGAAIALLPPAARSRRTEVPKPGPAWGSPGLNYTVPLLEPLSLVPPTSNPEPMNYWVPRGAFFQVNRFLLPELLALVTATANSSLAAQLEPARAYNKSATSPQLAWDLYAGVGLFARALFSRTLARSFAHVTAVEIAEPAFTALSQTKLSNLRAVKATALDFLRGAVIERDRPALIALDPPRTGAGAEVCALLARIAAPTLVYVSCSPRALAADLAALAASGYSVSQLHLFDLFPQTMHIETVAILTRSL